MKLGRKITGGKYHSRRKKKMFELPGKERKVILKETKRKYMRVRAGDTKTVLLAANIANIYDPKTKKMKKAKIKNVVETPQNIFLARQNLLMKSAIIETELGKARITNRPGQEGHVNAVLIQDA